MSLNHFIFQDSSFQVLRALWLSSGQRSLRELGDLTNLFTSWNFCSLKKTRIFQISYKEELRQQS